MFRVYQDGVRCADFGIQTWDVDTFKTKRDAEIFALMWSYPYTKEYAEVNHQEMQLGIQYNISGDNEFPTMMEIVEVDGVK